jgi:hypothetical protein
MHTGPYHGGSIGLSLGRNIEAGKTEAVEIRVAQGLLDGRTGARNRLENRAVMSIARFTRSYLSVTMPT